MDGYRSLESNRSFESVSEAVVVLDRMVLRLQSMENAQRRIITRLERLPVRRGARLDRELLIIDLRCEADKTSDALSVYGFLN